MVNSVVSSDSVKPAVTAIWDIVSGGLRQRALFVLVIGVAFIGGGVLAGPGRHAMAVRRFLAPYLRDRPVVVYSVLAVLFLLWLTIMPGINNLGQVIVIVILGAARRIRCGVAPSADGAGVPGSSPKFLSRRPIALIPAPFAGRARLGS